MNKIQKTFNSIVALTTLATVSPISTFANNIQLNLINGSSFNNVTTWTPTRLIGALVNLILILAGIIAFFFLLWGGLQWILAGGDKEGTEKARKRITAALIGLVIVFSVYALISLAGSFLGVNLMNFTIVPV